MNTIENRWKNPLNIAVGDIWEYTGYGQASTFEIISVVLSFVSPFNYIAYGKCLTTTGTIWAEKDKEFLLPLSYGEKYWKRISAPKSSGIPNEQTNDGQTCKVCKQYYPYAGPNQSDGSLICYSCRTFGVIQDLKRKL